MIVALAFRHSAAALLAGVALWHPGPTVPPHTPATGATSSSAASPYVLPVAGPAVVLTAFRPPASRYGPGHRGVDLAAATGGQVLAAGAGVVAFAGPVAGRGVISIDHPDGIRTTYEPRRRSCPGRRSGDRRARSSERWKPGHPSCAPASCLHWGARLPDGSYLDPMGLLDGLDVRLLPWARVVDRSRARVGLSIDGGESLG